MILMDWVRKITDIIMPIETQEEEEIVEKKVEEKPKLEQTQAQSLVEQTAKRTATATGGNVITAHPAAARYNYESSTDRPNLKLIKAPEFVMKVYTPANYDHINEIADDILNHKAIVVNYEYVREDEQRRICDYVDGVCYAIDGAVTKIAEKIYLYVPAGISTSDIAALVASVRYR